MATATKSQPSTIIPAVSSITPAKPRTLRQQNHDAMLQAAKNALELGVRNGVNIHIFAAPYKTKKAFKGSHGSLGFAVYAVQSGTNARQQQQDICKR